MNLLEVVSCLGQSDQFPSYVVVLVPADLELTAQNVEGVWRSDIHIKAFEEIHHCLKVVLVVVVGGVLMAVLEP